MTKTCIPPEEFGALVDAAADDPRLAHLADCPSCRGTFAAYRRFLEEEADADARAAAAKMAAVLEREIGAARLPAGRRRPALLRPAVLGPALAAAALAAVAILGLLPDRIEQPSGLLRSGGERPGHGSLPLHAPVLHGDGVIALAWGAVPGATDYEVGVFGPDLAPLATYRVAGDTLRVLAPEELASLGGEDSSLIWRVEAFRDGERIARSAPKPLQLPVP